jgi:AraC-like DNA-binding protein
VQVTVVAPSAPLAPFVRRFTIVETDAEATRALLPEHGLVFGVRFAGSATLIAGDAATRVADVAVTGMLGATRLMRTSAGGGIVLAMFRETGAARFFAAPLHELFGQTLAADVLVPRAELARLQQRVATARDHAGRVAIVEQFLLARMQPGDPDPLAAAAVHAIRDSHGAIRIADLARTLAITQDPLEKRFRRAVGTSPKHLASLIRLSRVIEAQRQRSRTGTAASDTSWARLAIAAGYFDQSHFIREFRALTGAPPGRFFRAGGYC